MPAKAIVQRALREAGIGIALLVLIAIFSATAPHFMDESNVTNILTQITINLIMATGMTFVILIGGIDLSVGSVMALCAMVAGLVLKSRIASGSRRDRGCRADERRCWDDLRLHQRICLQLLERPIVYCHAWDAQYCPWRCVRGDRCQNVI